MTWFRNDRIVQGPEQPPAQPSTGQLFRAESVLKLIPEFSDANANFSCHIHHQAHKGPKVLNFRLRLQGEFDLLLGKQGLLAAFLQLSSHSLFILTCFLTFGLKGSAESTKGRKHHLAYLNLCFLKSPHWLYLCDPPSYRPLADKPPVAWLSWHPKVRTKQTILLCRFTAIRFTAGFRLNLQTFLPSG